jgi:hypothetical protein
VPVVVLQITPHGNKCFFIFLFSHIHAFGIFMAVTEFAEAVAAFNTAYTNNPLS